MNSETVLISGAGIAFWLARAGFKPTLIECAPALRTSGYVIDFWGLGYDIAERMGLTDEINRAGYHIREMRIVDDNGDRITGFGTRVFKELTGGRFVTLGRGDLSRLLFEKVTGTTETIFGEEIISLQERSDGVEVEFRDTKKRWFDLVELDQTFATAGERRPDAVIILSSPIFGTDPKHIAELALANHIPIATSFTEITRAGGLMAYGPNLLDTFRQAGIMLGKILQGARAADLPVERPTKFELVINLKTAKALGLTVSPELLATADEVIE